MTDGITIDAKRDDFSTESPVRAFTDFQVAGNYAIGKGFRPALAHLARYLDAMERKEGWALVQIIEAANPTIIFVKLTINAALPPLVKVDPYVEITGSMLGDSIIVAPRQIGMVRELGMGYGHRKGDSDDPVNPKHYNGRECADVGERLSANSYQVLKYCWRLGKKDDPCVELGKAIWYLDSEMTLNENWDQDDDLDPLPNVPNTNLPKREWLDAKCADLDEWGKAVAVMLWEWNRTGEPVHLRKLRTHLSAYKAHLDCGNGLAI